MKRKKIDVKFYSGEGSSELFSFDKETFDLITSANAELARMVTVKDHRIAVLERALELACQENVENMCIANNIKKPEEYFINQAKKELDDK